MAFDPKFRIGREDYYVPSNSSYLWNSSDALEAYYDERVFFALVEKKQNSNDPNYYLSLSMAYDHIVLERLAEPVRSALRQKIDAVNAQYPDTFISYADIDAMKFPHMRLITAQWVIFNQDPHSQEPPSLSISHKDNGKFYDLPSMPVAGEKDFHELHSEYTLIANSMHNPGSSYVAGMYIQGDDVAQRRAQIKADVPDIRNEFKLNSIDEFGLVELHPIDEETLGIVPKPVAIITDDGSKRTIPSFNVDDGTKITFAMFGLIKPPRQELIVHFPNPDTLPMRYYPEGPRGIQHAAEPPVMSGMLRHLLDILEENGKWPRREAPKQNRLSRVMRKLFRLGD